MGMNEMDDKQQTNKERDTRGGDRIDHVIDGLRAIWREHPDLRLGQLINNAVAEPLLYYIEDDKMIDSLRRFYKSEEAAGGEGK